MQKGVHKMNIEFGFSLRSVEKEKERKGKERKEKERKEKKKRMGQEEIPLGGTILIRREKRH